MSAQLQMFGEKTSQESTLSPLDHLAKTLVRLEIAGVSKETEAVLSLKQYGLSENADQEFLFGKMLKELSTQMMAKILRQSSKPLPVLGAIDLNGNCLIQRTIPESHKTESEYTLLDILEKEEKIGEEYFLSQKSVERILSYRDTTQSPILCVRGTEITPTALTLVRVNGLHKKSED